MDAREVRVGPAVHPQQRRVPRRRIEDLVERVEHGQVGAHDGRRLDAVSGRGGEGRKKGHDAACGRELWVSLSSRAERTGAERGGRTLREAEQDDARRFSGVEHLLPLVVDELVELLLAVHVADDVLIAPDVVEVAASEEASRVSARTSARAGGPECRERDVHDVEPGSGRRAVSYGDVEIVGGRCDPAGEGGTVSS